jgi:hypothetical protein
MTLSHGKSNMAKTNTYRRGVDQPMGWYWDQASTARYCRHMLRIAPARMLLDQALLMPDATHPTRGLSPDPGAADSLFTFMAQRFVASYDMLGCSALVRLPDPITVSADAQGVVTAATISSSAVDRCKRALASTQAQDEAANNAAQAAASIE